MIINDDYIKEKFITKKNQLAKNYTRLSWLNKHQDIYDYLINRYNDSESIQETIYRIVNKIEIRPVCETCGKPVRFNCYSRGFRKFCSNSRCVMNSVNVQNKIKNTLKERYGVEHQMQLKSVKDKIKQTCLEKYGVSSYTKTSEYLQKTKETNLERYGVEFSGQNEEVKQKSINTCLKKYGCKYSFQSDNNKEKSRETVIKKYGVDNPAKNEEIKNKIKETKLELYGDPTFNNKEKTKETVIKKYGSLENFHQYQFDQYVKTIKKKYKDNFGMSKPEYQTYEYLQTIFDKDDIQFNVNVDERYPFHVDFYIKPLDLFIEINAFWTHGKHLFDEDNKDDIDLLNKWKQKAEISKQYKSAVNVWSIIDPFKCQTAKMNNLNYLPIWSNKIEIIKTIINEYLENNKRECI